MAARGGTGIRFVAPSEIRIPVSASAVSIINRAKSHAGCVSRWCAPETFKLAVKS